MSGALSRANRTAAVKAAEEAVYRYKGEPIFGERIPFSDPRQRRIFIKYYNQLAEKYHQLDRLVKEMKAAYKAFY